MFCWHISSSLILKSLSLITYNLVELYFTEKQASFFLRLSLLYKLLKKSCLPGCDYWPYHRHGYLAKAILLLVGIISLGRNGITCIDHKTLPWEWSAFIKGIFSLYCVTVQQAEKHFQNSIVLNCWDKILFAWEAGNPPSATDLDSPPLPTMLILETSQTLFFWGLKV